jgi:hypothetical protein
LPERDSAFLALDDEKEALEAAFRMKLERRVVGKVDISREFGWIYARGRGEAMTEAAVGKAPEDMTASLDELQARAKRDETTPEEWVAHKEHLRRYLSPSKIAELEVITGGRLRTEDPHSSKLDEGSTRRALDELFSLTHQYRTTQSYDALLKFIARFRFYAPFNAMLVHTQMPGATFVYPPDRWLREHRRYIKPGARPLVILQPMGPVMFVFDVSDTEPESGAPALPKEIAHPFEVRGGSICRELELTIENAKRDGIRTAKRSAGSQSAGQIGVALTSAWLEVNNRGNGHGTANPRR